MMKDRVTGLIALVLGIVVAVNAYQLPPSAMTGDVGPAVFPYITAALLIVCGGSLVIKGDAKEAEPYFTKKQLLRLLLFLGTILLYCVGMDLFGYPVPTLAFSFAACMMFNPDPRKGWPKALIFSAIMTVAIYLIFVYAFKLVLPTGRL